VWRGTHPSPSRSGSPTMGAMKSTSVPPAATARRASTFAMGLLVRGTSRRWTPNGIPVQRCFRLFNTKRLAGASEKRGSAMQRPILGAHRTPRRSKRCVVACLKIIEALCGGPGVVTDMDVYRPQSHRSFTVGSYRGAPKRLLVGIVILDPTAGAWAPNDPTHLCGDTPLREGHTAGNWRRNAIHQIDFGAVDECGAGVRAGEAGSGIARPKTRAGGFGREKRRDQGAWSLGAGDQEPGWLASFAA
jgi:hypothetical protein